MNRNPLSVHPLPVVIVLISLILAASADLAIAASVSISPAIGPPTAKAITIGSGFTAAETVNLVFDSWAGGSATADSTASFKLVLIVPKSAQPGAHTVKATGQTSGLVASVTFTVQTNWRAFKNFSSRIGVNSFENTINNSNAKFLVPAWQGLMGDLVDFSSPAVVNGVAYIGSFDGKLYAFNANGCAPRIECNPLWTGTTGNGIYSSPAVAKGIVYVG